MAKLLLLGVFLLAARFAYVVTIHGETCDASDFCFFSRPSSSNSGEPDPDAVAPPALSSRSRKAFVRAADGPPAWYSREWRKAVETHSAGFQDLLADGFLSQGSKALCLGGPEGHEVLALKEIGVPDAVGVAKKKSPPLVVAWGGGPFNLPFDNSTFDFVFVRAGILEQQTATSTKLSPFSVAAELERVMKAGGVMVVQTSSAGDVYSLNSFFTLFPSCALERSRQTGAVREMVLRKRAGQEEKPHLVLPSDGEPNKGNNQCSVIGGSHRQKLRESLVSQAEPLISEEPLKPWITLKRNVQNIKYLPTLADISFRERYVYVDVGARSYGSSIGSWFRKQYPKQNHTFDIYAVEADKAFHAEYAAKKKQRVHLLPYAAWVRNETLKFEVGREPGGEGSEEDGGAKGSAAGNGKGRGMGRIQPAGDGTGGSSPSGKKDVDLIQGLDFAEWLKSTVTERDYVVMKMDVEGTEFDLIPRLLDTGAICLVDELFLECHYNRWQKCCPGQRSPKYDKTYGQCLELFTSLRESGVLVHQWW